MSGTVPAIRFAGFTEPWEQRKLGDVVEVCSGRDYKHLDEGPIPVYGTGGFMTSVSEALSYDKDAIGIGRKGTIDHPYMLNAPFWTVDTLFYSLPRPGNDLEFLLCEFLNIDWKSKDESTGLPSLSKQAINETEIFVPAKPEQQAIGALFQHLDNLITLHQRKHDQLATLKKSLLEKMFPKSGSNVPELRFAGFTEPWEQRMLGELVDDIATGKSVNSDDGIVGPGDVGIMKTSCVSYDTFDAREAKRVLPEEQSLVECPVEARTLIVSRMNTPDRVGACGFVAGNWPNLFLPDRLWRIRLRNSVDPYLIYVLLTSEGSKEVLRGMASGTSGSMHNIPKESFLGMELTLPTSLEEQSKIAKQFVSLDSLITLHQHKHDQLATLKKSLLEKMFV